MAVAMTSHWITPVAEASQRNTFAGGTCRSAIAPNISGEMNAAVAVVANANGLMMCNPFASRIEPSGTNHMPIAAAWMKNKIINSAYSALRNVPNIRRQNMELLRKLKQCNRNGAGRWRYASMAALINPHPVNFVTDGEFSTAKDRLRNFHRWPDSR